MKALLVYPETPVTFWSFHYALRLIGKKASEIPLGMITMAAMLPETWTIRLVDMNVSSLTDAHIAWADVVMVGGMGVHQSAFETVVRRANSAGKTVIAGGPMATLERPQLLGVDHWLLGEVEGVMPTFLRDFSQGSAKSVYQSEHFPDLALTPTPRWDLLEMKRYAAMNLQFSRGCPHECEFCTIAALNGRRPRNKAVDQVIEELESLYRAGWCGGVFVVDDNFIGNSAFVRDALLPAIIQWSVERAYPFSFTTEATITLERDELLVSRMVEAGFRSVFLGIETPEDESLAGCKKRINRTVDLKHAVHNLQRNGLLVNAGFIVGFDEDTEAVFQNQHRFIQESGISTAMVGLLNAPMGSKLYERLERQKRLIGKAGVNNTNGQLNFIPKMAYRKLMMGYRWLLSSIYTPNDLYDRIVTLLQRYRKPIVNAGQEGIKLSDVFRAFWRLGVLDRGRRQFWRLVAWTLATRPRLVVVAVTLWAYGYHFRRVADLL